MTNEEILKKVIKKYYTIAQDIGVAKIKNTYRVDVYLTDVIYPTISVPMEYIIFDTMFAQEFFGTSPVDVKCDVCENFIPQLAYSYHLQQISILSNEERVKYLGKYL